MPTCEWSGCTAVSTHTVTIEFPGEPRETWNVCRQHDRVLKVQAVASRRKAEPPKQQPTTVEVCCGDCQVSLDERSDLPPDERQPCPKCGSIKRLVKVGIRETLTMHASVRARSRRPGKGGWIMDTQSGDDYTRMLEGWGRREVTKNENTIDTVSWSNSTTELASRAWRGLRIITTDRSESTRHRL